MVICTSVYSDGYLFPFILEDAYVVQMKIVLVILHLNFRTE